MADKQFDDEMRFGLWPNKDKQPGDKRPNVKGFIQIGGNRFDLSGWTRTSQKDGSKFITGQVQVPKPKDTGAAPAPTQAQPVQAEPVVTSSYELPPADDIPF
jgi:hypothetical protein